MTYTGPRRSLHEYPSKSLCHVGPSCVLFSIPALAQKVEIDYDHSVNFNQYHTYLWGHVRSIDPFFEQRIRDAVDPDLQGEGMATGAPRR
ncbi:MAG TPA: DUF4136 domain-containing protein [Edaphobacter sp.]|nr:DUF4136 domain-containing protein [Edaphobacter sp.]